MKEVILVWKRSNWHEYSSHQQRFSITFCSAINWFSFYYCDHANVVCGKRRRSIYKKMAKFWTQLFLINFAVGVVTGILQEFQFGMNWSTYSRFVGDVFVSSLAIEGLLAFFIESTFLGLWVFGEDKLPKRIHLMCIWLLSIGTMLSAFWILTASAFMQSPVGYEMATDGRAQMNDFLAIIQNPQLWVQFRIQLQRQLQQVHSLLLV